MHVLVTGAGGFLGRYIVEQLLARGDSVRGFARGEYPELAVSGVEMIRGDISDPLAVEEACAGMDAVFHTAAIAGIWGPWREFYEINTVGTHHVVRACRHQGVRKLVFSSSPSVTFDACDQCGVDESAPYSTCWLCHYPHTKALAEKHVLASHDNDGLMTCALRPHLIWGPRDQHLIPRLLARAREGKLRVVGDGKNLIDTVYVENAARAHLEAADHLEPGSPVGGHAYFISNGEPVNCWAWINQILELADVERVRKSVSLRTAWNIGRILEATHRWLRIRNEPRMTRFLAAQLARSHYFDIRRARRDFGYEPKISNAEGMRRLQASMAEEI